MYASVLICRIGTSAPSFVTFQFICKSDTDHAGRNQWNTKKTTILDLTLMGPFLRTPTPNSDRPPMLSSNEILVAGSTIAAAAAETVVSEVATATTNKIAWVSRDILRWLMPSWCKAVPCLYLPDDLIVADDIECWGLCVVPGTLGMVPYFGFWVVAHQTSNVIQSKSTLPPNMKGLNIISFLDLLLLITHTPDYLLLKKGSSHGGYFRLWFWAGSLSALSEGGYTSIIHNPCL